MVDSAYAGMGHENTFKVNPNDCKSDAVYKVGVHLRYGPFPNYFGNYFHL